MDFKPAKKLGFGLMRMPLLDPSDEASVDVEQVCKMVDIFLELADEGALENVGEDSPLPPKETA